MITLENVKGIVAECLSIRNEPVAIDVDSPIMIDSFSLVWIQQLLEERYNIEIDPEHSDVSSFTSVRAFHGYLAKKFPDRVSLAG
ncbi:acyl carrier protein [Streptomyces klenkii]|uniref:acyl carrier protein n=1 Tax=Streptomyces klenkii TaxID=1420899 RepID=UPI00340781B7